MRNWKQGALKTWPIFSTWRWLSSGPENASKRLKSSKVPQGLENKAFPRRNGPPQNQAQFLPPPEICQILKLHGDSIQTAGLGIFFFLKRMSFSKMYLFICLAASGLSCGTRGFCQVHRLCGCGTGLVVPEHVGSQLPNQESNPYLLHCKTDASPWDHQGSSRVGNFWRAELTLYSLPP